MESISVFDMLKVGIGPSSSHTLGPWKAALLFLSDLSDTKDIDSVSKVKAHLYGSLALTGKGHGTDMAVCMGLHGFDPKTVPSSKVGQVMQSISNNQEIDLGLQRKINFNLEKDIAYHSDQTLPYHANGMKLEAYLEGGKKVISKTYYSIGGGFVTEEGKNNSINRTPACKPVVTASDLKQYCDLHQESIAWVVKQNELCWNSEEQLDAGVIHIWETMLETVYRGCHTSGVLPGGLKVSRRAADIYAKLIDNETHNLSPQEWLTKLKSVHCSFETTLRWVSCFAMATNEENASYGRVVTAPTNGAAGVIPAVMLYYICFSSKQDITDNDLIDFLLTASEIGCLFKKKATISAAMGGCQAEIGVSSAMAAAGLTAGLGGSPAQVLMAAEIAMEHHLGMTCDPLKGLVQVPCIERNSMGAIKAITASQIAIESDPSKAKVSLDDVIATMWETACDMNHKYKETSLGGLATNISVSISEC